MKIAILGAGAWAQLCHSSFKTGSSDSLVYEPELFDTLQKTRRIVFIFHHSLYMNTYILPKVWKRFWASQII